MKKATSKEFLSALEDFKVENTVTDPHFDYYATLKFLKSNFLNDFYNLSIVKTNSVKHPILLQYSNRNLLSKLDVSSFFGIDKDTIGSYVPVIKKEDHYHVEKITSILTESTSFKSFVNNMKKEFGDDLDLNEIGEITDRLISFKVTDTFMQLERILKEKKPKENAIRHQIDKLEEALSSEIFLGKSFSAFQLVHNFRAFVIADEKGYTGPFPTNYDGLMDNYYNDFDQYFDLFKFQQLLKTGLLLNAKTEEALLDTPLLNKFIETLKASQPTWFKSLEESLVHYVTDDNQIRETGVPLSKSTADFDLISKESVNISALPSHTDGYSTLSGRFMGSEQNNIHIYGDNVFFKEYYHNLIINNRKFPICTYIDTEISYSIPKEKRIDYIVPVLDYLEKNKIVLDLQDSNCSFIYQLPKEELHTLVKEKYPNLVFLHSDIDMGKSIDVCHAESFDEAFKIYNKKDEITKQKKTKLKKAL